MIRRLLAVFITLVSITFLTDSVYAQDESPYPSYIVQPGETLTQIAQKFGVTLDALIKANGIINADLISQGTVLVIPGLEGVQGLLTTKPVGIGESLASFVRAYQADQDVIVRINKILSPAEIYAGTNMIIPVDENKETFINTSGVSSDQSALELAIIYGTNPYAIAFNNLFKSPINILPGDPIYIRQGAEEQQVSPISAYIQSVNLAPLPLMQGKTSELQIYPYEPAELSGSLDGHQLQFFYNVERGFYYALQGIHAMAEPGLTSLHLKGKFDNGKQFAFEQNLLLESGNFIKDPPIYVKDETIDPAITQPEDEVVRGIISQINPEKYWSGPFRYPVDGSVEDDTIGFMSVFGSRRSYNNSDYIYFHTGLDFGVFVNSLNIYACAPGKVVFADTLTVRGKTIFIDHGQGIFSGYFHQAEILVQEGDFVEQGQLIGLIGNTGRVTGPHLHWEIWVNGVQVNPVDWVLNTYP